MAGDMAKASCTAQTAEKSMMVTGRTASIMAKALRSTKTATWSIRASGRLTYPMEKVSSSLITYADTKAILLMANIMAKASCTTQTVSQKSMMVTGRTASIMAMALRTTKTATFSMMANGIITFLFAMFNIIKTVAFTKASS